MSVATAQRKASTDLLRKTRQLKGELAVFRRSARDFWGRLDPLIPQAEIEAMTSPEANLLGTLEQLLNDDLDDLERQLDEVDGHISGRLGPAPFA